MILRNSKLTSDKHISSLQDFPQLIYVDKRRACHVSQTHMTMESLSREYLMKITHFEEYRPRQMALFPELKLISVLVFGIKI